MLPATVSFDRLRTLVRRRIAPLVWPHDPEPGASRPRAAYLALVFLVRRSLHEDRLPTMAAVLTLQTALAVAPAVGVALAGLGALGPEEAERLLARTFATWMPANADPAGTARNVIDLARGVSARELGVAGFLAALAVAYLAFASLEATISRVFRAERRHGFVVKFTLFYTLATLGPLVALYSLRAGFADPADLLPRAATAAALWMLYVLVPRTKVAWLAALGGAVLAAALLEAARGLFGLYLERALGLYESIYGPLALLPVFLLWSYISWLAVLVGAEVVYLLHHRRTLRLSGWLPRPRTPDGPVRCAAPVAARLLLAIADNFDRRGAPLDAHALAERFGLPVEDVAAVLRVLLQHGFVARARADGGASFVPGRPLDRIVLSDVLAAFDLATGEPPRDDRLSALLDDLRHVRRARTGAITYADLLADARARRDGAAGSDGVAGARKGKIAHDHGRHDEHGP